LVVLAAIPLATTLRAAERQRIEVQSYVIDAVVTPQTHRLAAKAQIRFTALDDISMAVFELHNGLRPTKVIDGAGNALSAERVSQDSTIRISLPNGLAKGQSETLTIDYEGSLQSGDDSPVPGLKLAYVGDPMSYLLYAGRWFPMVGYGTNRFTSTIKISAPAGYTIIGSGKEATGVAAVAAEAKAEQTVKPEEETGAPKLQHRKAPTAATKGKAAPAKAPTPSVAKNQPAVTFTWDKPGFPGTILIGKYELTKVSEGGSTISVYFAPGKQQLAKDYGETASKELAYFTTLYGVPQSGDLKIVEMPDDTIPAAWAPEIAALSHRVIAGKLNYRLLANTISRQWWGVQVSPATRNDFWITDGGARYSEARYIEFAAGRAGAEEAIKDMSVGALAYESVPLSQIGSLDPFDPVFQSMSTDKGGMVFHMLRWVLGDQKFDNAMRKFLAEYKGKPVTQDELRKVAEEGYGDQLAWFFSQWLDSTGAPEFKNKYTIFRTNKGFRIVGEISQDLDLFRMPVDLKIDTDGKTEVKRIDVVGTNSSFAVETFGKPRKITIDPGNWVLKNSSDIKIRASIMRGQQLVAQGNLAESLREFQKALDINKNSSLAHYRVAEVFYLQRNYQAAANAYRDSLNGDGEPRWTEVWSHIQLGKIFDVTGQRERAVNEYRQALQTNDNTQGALDEARRFLQTPFSRNQDRSGQ
jgi:tetratricopeptide (TPR) repeat protein